MPARVFTQKELYDELEKVGFKPTKTKTLRFTIWKNEKGDCVSVNHIRDCYPYTYLNDLLGPFGDAYNFSGINISEQKYIITKDNSES